MVNKSTQHNQQTEPKQCKSDVIPKPGKWSSQHLYLKINSEFHARKNPKQQYLKVVTSRSVMLHSGKSALLFTNISLLIAVKILFNFKKKNVSLNAVKENLFNIIKNQEFELITSRHFQNLISPKPAWNIQWSLANSFEKFKAIASLPILFALTKKISQKIQ